MRLLTLVLALTSNAVRGTVARIKGPDGVEPTPTRVPPKPRYFTPPRSTKAGQPWRGYAKMTAAEIRKRVRDADPETATAVMLFESAHKGRKTVLEEADRRVNARPSG
jgi:hypothetical protein